MKLTKGFRLKRITSLRVNSYVFNVIWDNTVSGGSFSFSEKNLTIGTRCNDEDLIFMILCHELQEMSAIEMNVRMQRPDCNTDYIFVYDHRQFETMINMFAGLLKQFL